MWVEEVIYVLLTSVWKQANRLTRKGCRMVLATSKIRFSLNSDSTSSRVIMSPFLSAFIAKYSPRENTKFCFNA